MQTQRLRQLAISVTTVFLAGCPDIDGSYEAFLEQADSHTTTGVATGEDSGSDVPPPLSTTGSDDSGSTSADPDPELPNATSDGAIAPPEILEFSVDPPVIDAAGPVNISATFSPSVTKVVLFEKYDGETHVLEVTDPVAELAHEYAVTSDNLNGTHEVYVQAFDDDGQLAQSISSFEAALPTGGTPIGHDVDYDPEDSSLSAYGADLVVHGDGVVVVGMRYVDLGFHLIARRYTSEFDLDWEFETSEEVSGNAVTVDAEGNVLLVGDLEGTKPRMWLHKLDANGVPIWNAARTGVPGTRGLDVSTSVEGQIFVAGRRTVAFELDPDLTEDDAMIWEFNPSGAMDGWAFCDNNDEVIRGDDDARGVAILGDDRVVLAGTTMLSGNNNEKVRQAALYEYAQYELSLVWVADPALVYESDFLDLVGDAQGGVVAAGWSSEGVDEPERLMVRRLDASFQASWEYPGYPASNPAGRMNAIALDPEGRAAVGGSIVVGEQRDVRVMSVKPSGWPAWFPAYDYAGADGADDHIYGVATDRFGYVYYTGAETVGGVSRLMLGKVHP